MMKREDYISIIVSFVLGVVGVCYAYLNSSTNTLFGLPAFVLLVISFLISFVLLFIIFKYLVFGLILKKTELISGKEIPKVTSNVTNTFVPGSTVPQSKPTPIKPQVTEPIKEDVSIIVENITDPVAISEKKKALVVDNTIDTMKFEERKIRRDEIVKEAENKTLADFNLDAKKPKEEVTQKESDVPKFKKLTSFEDIDNK